MEKYGKETRKHSSKFLLNVTDFRVSSFKRRPPINAAFGKEKVKQTPSLINAASSSAQMQR